jgi:Spy/CpxP family protein refolding chaperone
VWLLPAGALVASLGWPGTEVLALTGRQPVWSVDDQTKPPAAPQTQAAPPVQAGRAGEPRQGPGGRSGQPFGSWEWWKDDANNKEIGLSAEKVRKISEIYQDRMKQMKPYADEWLKQLEILNQMTAERIADDTTYGIQVKRVESLGMTLRESRTLMLYRIYRQLQPDQYQKLQVIIQRSMDRNGRGRGIAPHTR